MTVAPRGTPARDAPLLWVGGARVDPNALHISALDRGFTLADGLFETMRLVDGSIFRLERHLARLSAGAARLDLPLPMDVRDVVLSAVRDAVAARRREGSVRLTVSRGPAGGTLAPPDDPAPTVVVVVRPPTPPDPARYDSGVSGHIPGCRRNERSATAGLKTLSYTESVAALAAARAAGADEAILLDTEGHLSEATASNIFLVDDDGTVITPPAGCAALPGITREAVLELCVELGVAAEERVVRPGELRSAAEAFLTNTNIGVLPLASVDGTPVGSGRPGPVTQRLMLAYQELVARECRA